MNREEERMQFLGFFGIFRERYRFIVSYTKFFAQITLSLFLPLTFIFLALVEISNFIFRGIKHAKFPEELAILNTRRYNDLLNTLSFERITFWLFKVEYITILLLLSLLSTTVVVYTIASVYTRREMTFMKVMSFIPKLWKRLMNTFFFVFMAFFLYNLLALLIIMVCLFIVPHRLGATILLFIVLMIYMMGFFYMMVIWQLASVVSVLESSCGLKPMTKSNDLIKGNRLFALFLFFLLSVSIIQFSFQSLVLHGSSPEAWKRVGLGVLCLLFLSIVFLFGFVIHTTLYLVCKSNHHDNIDKEDLSDHLESYLGEYEPLSGKDVLLEHVV